MQEAHRRLLEQIKEEKEKKKLRYIEKQVKKEGGLVPPAPIIAKKEVDERP